MSRQMMSRLLITLTMLLMAVPVEAQNWTEYSESDSAVNYIDLTTLRINGEMRRVWELQDLKTRHPDGEMSRRYLTETDCKEERYRILGNSEHPQPMAGGAPLFSSQKPGEWRYIAPGTVTAIVLRLVCAKR